MVYVIDEKKLKKIEKDYKHGLKYAVIQEKYNISYNKLLCLIRKYKWKRKSNRSEVQKGNKNSVGNKGGPGAEKGNKRAVTTGEYESIYKDVLDDEELELFNNYNIKDKKEELMNELKLLTIREKRMLKRIADLKNTGKDLTINSITRNKSSTTEYGGMANESSSTYAESTVEKIQRIEEALTRVQESKRKCIEAIHKLELEDNKFELELLRFERQVAADEPEDSTNENNKTSSLINALNIKASEVWLDDKK